MRHWLAVFAVAVIFSGVPLTAHHAIAAKFDPAKAAAAQKAVAKQKATGQPISLLGQFNIDELKLANAAIANNTSLQRTILQNEKEISLKLRDQAKTLKDRTKYAQKAASIEDQIRAIDQAGTRAAKKAAAQDQLLAKARLDLSQGLTAAATKLLTLDKRRLTALLREAKTQTERISIERQLTAVQNALKTKATGFSVPLALQVADAKAQALGKSEVTILEKIRSVAQKALQSGKLGLQGQLDAWNEIASVNTQLKNAAQFALGSFKEANTKALVAGLGLTAAQAKALRGRLSQIGPTGAVPRQGVGAFGFQIGSSGTIVIHTHVQLDKHEVGKALTNYQIKRNRRNSSQSRGPFAGGVL